MRFKIIGLATVLALHRLYGGDIVSQVRRADFSLPERPGVTSENLYDIWIPDDIVMRLHKQKEAVVDCRLLLRYYSMLDADLCEKYELTVVPEGADIVDVSRSIVTALRLTEVYRVDPGRLKIRIISADNIVTKNLVELAAMKQRLKTAQVQLIQIIPVGDP